MSKQEAADLVGWTKGDMDRETESINPEEPYYGPDPCDLAEWHNEAERAADAMG